MFANTGIPVKFLDDVIGSTKVLLDHWKPSKFLLKNNI